MNKNFVVIHYELVSLVFRLAGKFSHSDAKTPYQQDLNSRFEKFLNHPAGEYAKSLDFEWCAVLTMAVHLKEAEEGFALTSTQITDKFN